MYTLTDLTSLLKDDLLAAQISSPTIPDNVQIAFIDGLEPAREGVLYLAEESTVSDFLMKASCAVTVLISGTLKATIPDSWHIHNIIQVNMPLSRLYNLVHRWLWDQSAEAALASMILGKSTLSASELLEKLKNPVPPSPCWIVMEAADLANCKNRLMQLFPDWNYTLINNQLWVLGVNTQDNQHTISEVMQEIDGVCCFGKQIPSYGEAGAAAELTRSAMQLALMQRKFSPDASPQRIERIYRVDDEVPDLLFYYASSQMKNCAGKPMLQQLLHPLVQTLYEYDENNGTDLSYFLFLYLMTDSISAVASGMHIHRNTAYNWLKQLHQMGLPEQLNGYERFILQLSCMGYQFLWKADPTQSPKTLRNLGEKGWKP